MKSIYKKVRFSPFFLMIIFLSLLSGLFKDVLSLFLIIIIHELGHVLISLLFKWKIQKIDITICGGFITYDDIIDKAFNQEIIISLAGFFFQFILYLITCLLFYLKVIDIKLFSLINRYNLSIFLFNVLPIYPLDGSKLLFVLYCMIMPYKKALKLINITSFISIFMVIIYFVIFNVKFEYSYIMIICFILIKIINFTKDIPYLFNKFLFQRYIYGTNSKKYKYINKNDLTLFERRKKHYFLIGKHYYDEKKVLAKRFD